MRTGVAVTDVPPPNWAALYDQHKDAMYRVARSVLRPAGREAEAEDAVMAAMESLMKSPPYEVDSWEAVMVTAAKRRAVDLLRSAAARHAGPPLEPEDDRSDRLGGSGLAEDVAEQIDRERAGAILWDKLALLDERHRIVVWEYKALGRPREEVAAELGVTPSRVSQIAIEALRVLRDALKDEGVEL
jgi:RNA polymerase sigma factor (sigma-70 family)